MTEQSNIATPELEQDVKAKEPILARFFSIILHPLLMATYGICLLFLYTDFGFRYPGQFSRFIIPVFVSSFLLPANGIFLLKISGRISSYRLEKKEERLLPFLITFVCYTLLFVYFQQASLSLWFLSLLIAPLILLILAAVITPMWKVSAHMMAMGGLIGGVFAVSYFVKQQNPYILFIILIILAGCLAVSRLILRRHTPKQVYIGFLIGLFTTFLCVWIGVKLSYIIY